MACSDVCGKAGRCDCNGCYTGQCIQDYGGHCGMNWCHALCRGA